MKRLRSFVSITFIGGFMVVLPMLIFVWLVEWLLRTIRNLIQPLSQWLVEQTLVSGYVADIIGVGLLLLGLFLIGLFVSTSIGGWLHDLIDDWLARLAPGYKTIRDVITQLLGGEGNTSLLKGEVCRAYLMGRAAGVSVTAIVTAKHANGDYTVYAPTAPIPTSGFVYHLASECVDLLPHVSVEEAMRTVIACGSGSQVISEVP
ncbi:DUF502 domain-containing protein [Cellvibrio japonicus]|uniref:Putative membrane protein n=1 Tax=Cellvibrio japonicus (strain Ueda107) TaxID=498211 RepID=B3PKD9_CELJU|nr:DUF502 domain-containing protein [Cellvibrio japonicus]ACE84441.1 putative membrane protein [Cellvibrio japonicus Ueda107]QEI12809.1 DUF502 domain-containing protein [Cellvibrio japonicus]QEI16383.1 DUF502 domain-containing protein [Cellvibrio japonicus]QEI19961.1 DUF502 domain-containing protein [Cellvibrio japonicus]